MQLILAISAFLGHLDLREATVDYTPRNEAFWFRGPIKPDIRMVTKREGLARTKARHQGTSIHDLDQQEIHEPYDRAIQVSSVDC